MNKKGQLGNLSAGALALVAVAVLVGFGAVILSEIRTEIGTTQNLSTSTAGAAVANGTEAMGTIGKFTPLIALVVVAGVILAIILGVFAVRR